MFPKEERLAGQDIQWMMRRGKRWHGETLSFLVAPQRRDRDYSQWSVQIPVKLDKRATMRNKLRRALLAYIREHQDELMPEDRYYKVFIMINKRALKKLTQLIATSDKTTILHQRMDWCKKDFTLFARQVGSLRSRGSSRSKRK